MTCMTERNWHDQFNISVLTALQDLAGGHGHENVSTAFFGMAGVLHGIYVQLAVWLWL